MTTLLETTAVLVRMILIIAVGFLLASQTANAADSGDPPPPQPAPGGNGNGNANDGSILDELEGEVDDPLNGSGKVAEGLADAYKEFNEQSDNYFDSAHDDSHTNQIDARNTDGYQRLRDLKRRVEERLDIVDDQFDDWVEDIASRNADIRKAIDDIEETEDRPRGVQVVEIIDNAIGGRIGNLSNEEKDRGRTMLRAGRWINWLQDARDDLQAALELLEDTSAPYRRVSRFGSAPGKDPEQYAYRVAVQEKDVCVSTTYSLEEGSGFLLASFQPGDGPVFDIGQDGTDGQKPEGKKPAKKGPTDKTPGKDAKDAKPAAKVTFKPDFWEQAYLELVRRLRPDLADKIARKVEKLESASKNEARLRAKIAIYLYKISKNLGIDIKAAKEFGDNKKVEANQRAKLYIEDLGRYMVGVSYLMPSEVARLAEYLKKKAEAKQKAAEQAPKSTDKKSTEKKPSGGGPAETPKSGPGPAEKKAEKDADAGSTTPQTGDKTAESGPRINRPAGTDGDDHFDGTSGPDEFTGGKGKDTYFFDTDRNGLDDGDRITDYESGEEILIKGFRLGKIEIKYDEEKNETRLEVDTDGDGKADRAIILNGDKRGDVQQSRNCCGSRMATIQIEIPKTRTAEQTDKKATPKTTEQAPKTTGEKAPTPNIEASQGVGETVKATREVLLQIRNEQTGQPVESALVKFLTEDPDLPVAEAGGQPADTSAKSNEAYANDATGGQSDKDGNVLLASLFPGTNVQPRLRKNGAWPRAGLIANGDQSQNPAAELLIDEQKYDRLIVGLTGIGSQAVTSDSPATVPDGVRRLGFNLNLTSGYRIGDTSLLLVELPSDQVDAFTKQVSGVEGVQYVEPDPCFEKERVSESQARSSGITPWQAALK